MVGSMKLNDYFQSVIDLNKTSDKNKIRLSELLKVTKKDYKLDRISRVRRNNTCYFCEFDCVIHKHHIINRISGGENKKENLLNLCPNHHWLIHQGKWGLIYWQGYYFMYDGKKWNELVFPHKLQYGFRRKNPRELWKSSLKNLESKGVLKRL